MAGNQAHGSLSLHRNALRILAVIALMLAAAANAYAAPACCQIVSVDRATHIVTKRSPPSAYETLRFMTIFHLLDLTLLCRLIPIQ